MLDIGDHVVRWRAPKFRFIHVKVNLIRSPIFFFSCGIYTMNRGGEGKNMWIITSITRQCVGIELKASESSVQICIYRGIRSNLFLSIFLYNNHIGSCLKIVLFNWTKVKPNKATAFTNFKARCRKAALAPYYHSISLMFNATNSLLSATEIHNVRELTRNGFAYKTGSIEFVCFPFRLFLLCNFHVELKIIS